MSNRFSNAASTASSPASGPSAEGSGGSFMIDLRIHTSDPRRRELIRRYWKLGPGGSDFAEPFEALKSDFGLSRGGIVGIVRSDSTAFSGIHRCSGCGKRKEFDCRKDFRDTPKQKPYTCEKCANARREQAGAARRQAAVETPKEEGASKPEGAPGPEGISKEKKISREEEGHSTAEEVEACAGENASADADSQAEAEMETLGRPLRAAARELAEASRHLKGLARRADRLSEKQFG